MSTISTVSRWRRWLARWWYAWGLSLCHTGYRLTDRSFYEGGIRSFDRATGLWPTYPWAYYQRGLIRGRELNQYHAAVSDLTMAIELQPDWPEAYLQRGLFHRFNSVPEAALADLHYYLELGGEDYWQNEARRHISQLQAELTEG